MRIHAILLTLISFLLILSCEDEPPERSKLPEVTGVIIETSSGKPIENVAITGFIGGVYQNNFGEQYGQEVTLGMSDECGHFKITLDNSIKGAGAHGLYDATAVVIRLSRPDVGTNTTSVKFENSVQTFSMEYKPKHTPFFKTLSLVQSKDMQSVSINWNVHSLNDYYPCPTPPFGLCLNSSGGELSIQRSDSTGIRHSIPIQVNVDQLIIDDKLPAGNFFYYILPGDQHVTVYLANINRSSFDTLFLVKPPEFPILNHCN